jgi:putative nucleotidyltransferase with HDIG domain
MQEYAPLPEEVMGLCRRLHASPRLVAHLTLVHDVAKKLVEGLHVSFPGLSFDAKLVLFGAATHDLGKSVHPEELSAAGSEHERQGVLLLRKLGVSEQRSRFAYTHANWMDASEIALEDLLVALADNCWKGKRLAPLEDEVIKVISAKVPQARWEIFTALDEIVQRLAADADERLNGQARFPV